jgi:hypothetical protein
MLDKWNSFQSSLNSHMSTYSSVVEMQSNHQDKSAELLGLCPHFSLGPQTEIEQHSASLASTFLTFNSFLKTTRSKKEKHQNLQFFQFFYCFLKQQEARKAVYQLIFAFLKYLPINKLDDISSFLFFDIIRVILRRFNYCKNNECLL